MEGKPDCLTRNLATKNCKRFNRAAKKQGKVKPIHGKKFLVKKEGKPEWPRSESKREPTRSQAKVNHCTTKIPLVMKLLSGCSKEGKHR
jgi:hypothetical protein